MKNLYCFGTVENYSSFEISKGTKITYTIVKLLNIMQHRHKPKVKFGLWLFILFFIVCSNKIVSQDCSGNVDPNPRRGLPHPDCLIETRDLKCVRIKFHYINNTSGPSNSPTDQEFAIILDELNKAYRGSKIKFELAGECVHRATINTGTNSAFDLSNKVLDDSTGLPLDTMDPAYDPDMEYVADYINVYFAENISVPIGVYPGGVVVTYTPTSPSEILSFNSHLAHEVGHTLGLRHTHGQFGVNQSAAGPHDCLCKDPSTLHPSWVPPTRLCELVQDCLCDTGLDPYVMDLDDGHSDGKADRLKWVKNGRQIAALTPSIKDGCDNDTYKWDIPANNIMSYYDNPLSLRIKFTPCQMTLMHDILDNNIPNYLMECSEDDLYGTCDDIIISEPTTWTTNQILCRSQKIRIIRGGSLTLDDVTLTVGGLPDPPSGSCTSFVPDAVHYWQGIELDNTITEDLEDEDPPSLYVINHSVIEYAKTAITILNGSGDVEISGSAINNCLQLIDANDYSALSALQDGATSYPGGSIGCEFGASFPVIIIEEDSELSTDIISTYADNGPDQIKLNGYSIVVDGSTIINNESPIYTAINSSRGMVKLINGTEINNYAYGVYKHLDMLNLCTPRGLYAYDSSIKNGAIAVYNSSYNLFLRHNWFNKSVLNDGLSYSYIGRNNFADDDIEVRSTNTQKSSIVKENYFNTCYMSISEDNSGTKVTCNEWHQTANGVEIAADATLPTAWGDEYIVSGNKNDNNPRPDMLFAGSGSTIINYYKSGQTPQLFNWFGRISGVGTPGNISCSYDSYPAVAPDPDIHFTDFSINLNDLDEDYEYLDSLIGVYTGQLEALIGSAYTNKVNQINQLRIDKDELVRQAFTFARLADSSRINQWVDRLSPKLLNISLYFAMWYNGDFNDLSDSLDGLVDGDAEVLQLAADYMNSVIGAEKSIFELDSLDKDTLTTLALSSYDDYTNILRTYLDAEYDILILGLDSLSPRSSFENMTLDDKINTDYIYQLYPNPSNGCFHVKNSLHREVEYSIEVFNSLGQKMLDHRGSNFNDYLCMNYLPSGKYIVRIFEPFSNYHEVHTVVIR